jgi:hypothetical protein
VAGDQGGQAEGSGEDENQQALHENLPDFRV